MPPSAISIREYLNYPPAVAGPNTKYDNTPQNNPSLSGATLGVLSSVVSSLGSLQRILWSNAGFGSLSKLEKTGALKDIVPCFDPTVIALVNTTSTLIPSAYEALTTRGVSSSGSTFYSAADYVAAYKSGAVTPTQVAERILEILATDSTKEHYFIAPTPKDALLAAAAASTERYRSGGALPMDGVPLVVKDEVDVAGTVKTLGLSPAEVSRRLGNEPAKQSSFCVQTLLDAGMLLLGKANMHELGLDTTNDNPHWGTPTNPYNAAYYPGGSSGGSAACVGSGLVPIAVGADGGGSIRVPALYNGVWGLKPSQGRVSGRPTPSLAPSVGVLGPITATIADLEIAYRVMAAPDVEGGSASALFSYPGSLTSITEKVLGIYKPWFEDADAPIVSAVQSAVDALVSQKGYKVVDITLPYIAENRTAHAVTILSEIGSGICAGGDDVAGLCPSTKILTSIASKTKAHDLITAARLRAQMMQHLSHLFQTHPGLIIVTPTAPHPGVKIPPGAGIKGAYGISDSNKALRSMQYVFLANWTGCPAISAPCGYVSVDGGEMPVGMMGMAEWGGEDSLIDFGKEWDSLWSKDSRKRGKGWVDVLKKD
ncbi:hypothetical protein M422DRAFT_171455 [Sphaerobolus stellatus SS14]|uniref:Amidase domain-containing protein n=1 Tax=Sphaerobolus stellatus (strain SS14) TaxID=990650 RepID=A0A0C9VKE0_SPHS4|nr:hypothetical protein M422DRAFT_171455 [Sphaerobolus stellatus SS14]